MSKDVTYTEAKDFVSKHATSSEKDGRVTLSMTQGHYVDFMKTQGVEKETIKAVDHAERVLVAGAMVAAADALATKIKEVKGVGDSPDGLEAMVKIARPNGSLQTTVHGETHPRNIRTGEELTKYGSVTVRAKLNTLVDTAAAQECSDIIRTALVGK